MDAAKLVTHRVGRDVLLGALLQTLGLLHRLLEHRFVRLTHATDAEVHAGPHLLHLDAGELLPAALGLDEVDAEVDRGLHVAVAGVLVGGDGDDVLQALDVDLVGGLALEEIQEHALCKRVLVGDGALKGGAGEEDHGPQADGAFLGLELGHGAEALGVEAELEHVEDLVAERADERQVVRALLLAAAEDEEAGVVLLGEELERGGVLERVDGVLLGELLGEGLAEGVELVEGVLDDLGAAGAAEEEACLGVLDSLGFALLERPLGAGITGFSRSERSEGRKLHGYPPPARPQDLHLSKHLWE